MGEGRARVHLTDSVSYLCDKWVVHGLGGDNNYYYQHLSPVADDVARPPCEIDGLNWLHNPSQKADDQYIYDQDTYTTHVSTDTFDRPPFCSETTYCGAPHCDTPPALAP